MPLLLLCCTLSMAGINTGLRVLKGQHKIGWRMDWSKLTIETLSPDDWVNFRQAEQPQYDAKFELEEQLKPRILDMVAAANHQLVDEQMFLITDSTTNYTFVFQPLNITKKGNNMVKCYLKETKTDRTVFEVMVMGRGGVFGSMSNLWGDGFKDAGKRLGKMIVEEVK